MPPPVDPYVVSELAGIKSTIESLVTLVGNNATAVAALAAHQAAMGVAAAPPPTASNAGSSSSSAPIVQGTEIINVEESDDEPPMRTIGGKRVRRPARRLGDSDSD